MMEQLRLLQKRESVGVVLAFYTRKRRKDVDVDLRDPKYLRKEDGLLEFVLFEEDILNKELISDCFKLRK
jgi:hypothetical protein